MCIFLSHDSLVICWLTQSSCSALNSELYGVALCLTFWSFGLHALKKTSLFAVGTAEMVMPEESYALELLFQLN